MGKKFVAPENLQDLEAADLEAAVAAAFERVEELRPAEGEAPAAEVVEEVTAIRDFVRAAKEENAARTAEAEANAQLFADIDAEIDAAVPAEGEGTEGEGEGEGAPEGTEAEEVIPGEDAQPAEEAAAEPAGELVNAARKAPAKFTRGSLAAKAAKAAPKSQAPTAKAESARLINGGTFKQFEAGQQFNSLEDAATVLAERARALPKGKDVENTTLSGGGIMIALPQNKFSTANPEYQTKGGVLKMLRAAGDETRLTGKSLVAAGGWGAPSERSLDFCKLESIEGLFDMAEVSITHGGLEWTKGIDFASILASNTGFWDMTEAEAEAGTELKTSLRPSLPTFQERRLDAVGIMLEAGLLLRQGWPEVIARHAELLIAAHAYKLSQKKLAGIRGYTGAAVDAAGIGFGNAMDLFHTLELIATGERQRTFMSPNQTMEVVLPHWVKNVIRVDLANRAGVQDFKSIGDAQIDAEFTLRKLKAQWITGDQNLVIDPVKKIALRYPATIDVLMYPAGTFVAGVAPVISLDTIYDSTNLKKNDYVHLFIEQGVLVANPCGDGLNIRIPLGANGRRAIDDIAKNFGAPVV